MTPRTSDPPLGATAADGVRVDVHGVVGPEKSLVKSARWDEFVVTIRNDGRAPVVVKDAGLESANLPFGAHAVRSDLLAWATNENVRRLREQEPQVRTDLGDERPVECDRDDGGYLVGRVLTGTVVAIMDVIVSAALHLPLGLRLHESVQCPADTFLESRGFRLPLNLEPGKGQTRSLYFPLTPRPTMLRVQYEAGGEERMLRVPLPTLSTLHIIAGLEE